MRKNDDIKPVMGTQKAARTLGVTPRTLARWRLAGIGPAWVRVEGRIQYPTAPLTDYLEQRMHMTDERRAA